jgi:hypothetical protein
MTLTADRNGKKHVIPTARIEIGAQEIAERFGIAFEEYDTDGLGMALGHAFRLADGREIYMEQLLGMQTPSVYVNCAYRDDARTKQRTLTETFKALAVRPEQVIWVDKTQGLDADEIKAALRAAAPKGPGR